jgi:hypothetical protein
VNRTPPIEIRRQLRREVRFGCPVPGCGNPYLEWHHFDPPWHVKEHHNPEGMIALCSRHHPVADANAFTTEQIRKFKVDAEASSGVVGERFQWMRNRLLAVVGGNHYLETYTIFRYQGHPIIWFSRDEANQLLLNLHPLTTTPEPRLIMEENFWLVHGNQEDLDCPPSGRLVHAKYPNGDEMRIEFFELENEDKLRQRYPDAHPKVYEIETPITVVEVMYRLADTTIDFGPRYTRLGGIHMQRSFFQNVGTVFDIG